MHELVTQIDELTIANTALENSQLGGIFISYASEDYAIAWQIFSKLRNEGFSVWLDNRKIKSGDPYEVRISNGIKQAKIFLPILTDTISRDLSENKDRYYPKEWEIADSMKDALTVIPVTTRGYNFRSSEHTSKTVKTIADKTAFKWDERPFSELIELIRSNLKK